MDCTNCAYPMPEEIAAGDAYAGNSYRGLISCDTKTCAAADTENSLLLPTNVLGITIRNVSAAGLRFAFKTGVVADPTATASDNFEVAPFASLSLGQILPGASTTLYYASTLRGAQFELELELGSI